MFEYLFLHLKKGDHLRKHELMRKVLFLSFTTFPWEIWAKRSALGCEKAHFMQQIFFSFSNIKGRIAKIVLWQGCYGLLFISVLNLIKYDKTQTGRNSPERTF